MGHMMPWRAYRRAGSRRRPPGGAEPRALVAFVPKEGLFTIAVKIVADAPRA